jgi:putative copper resistance protein D
MLIALLIIARTAQIGASILLAGTFTFELVAIGAAGRSASDDLREVERRLLRLAWWSLILAFLSVLLWFWLPLTRAFSTTSWRTVLFETKFGRVWQLRLILIAVAFALAVSGLAHDEVRRRTLTLVRWFVSIVLVVSLAWISHAAAARVQPLGLLGDALHLCAASAWIGGLLPLAIFLTRARASVPLGERALPVIQRFSKLSLTCVGVLILTGIFNSWLLIGSIHALFTTPYGRLLFLKLALFGILIGLGARNRFVIKRKLITGSTGSDLLAQLRRNVICEVCLGVAVVAIVACLGVTPPARGH